MLLLPTQRRMSQVYCDAPILRIRFVQRRLVCQLGLQTQTQILPGIHIHLTLPTCTIKPVAGRLTLYLHVYLNIFPISIVCILYIYRIFLLFLDIAAS